MSSPSLIRLRRTTGFASLSTPMPTASLATISFSSKKPSAPSEIAMPASSPSWIRFRRTTGVQASAAIPGPPFSKISFASTRGDPCPAT